VYGILGDPSRQVDVTEQVRAMIRDGFLAVRAENQIAGDPAPMVVKDLRVDYTLDGRDGTATIREHETLTLPREGRRLPAAQPHVGADGTSYLLAWRGGRYEAQTREERRLVVRAAAPHAPLEVSGPWEVSFPPGLGAPSRITLAGLISWPKHTDPGVRYFSGTATYTKQLDVPEALLVPNRRVWLDLGRVENLARVRLNGSDLGILWKPPFALDVSDALRPGDNDLLVEVTNLWPNRLIGDEQLPDDAEWAPFGEQGMHLLRWPAWLMDGAPRPQTGRVAFTTWKHWHKDDALFESGLLGPVILRQAVVVPVPVER
jgi:hypothetical protein